MTQKASRREARDTGRAQRKLAREQRRRKREEFAQRVGPWTKAGATTTKAVGVGLIGTAVAAWAALLLSLGGASSDGIAAAPAGADPGEVLAISSERDVAAGRATVFLNDYLSAVGTDDADALADQVVISPAHPTVPREDPIGGAPATVLDADPVGQGKWRVELVDRTGQSWQVQVAVSGGSAQVLYWPSLAAGSPPDVGESSAVDAIPSQHPAAVTGVGFVTAMVIGSDDLVRWANPEFFPPVFPSAACEGLGQPEVTGAKDLPETPDEGEQAVVLVSATCLPPAETPEPTSGGDGGQVDPSTVTNDGTGFSVQWALTLQGRDQVWEVVAVTDDLTGLTAVTTNDEPADSPVSASPTTKGN